MQNHLKILDSSSDTSPSAPSINSSPESSTSNTTHTRNVTPVTPSKRPRSYVSETSSSSILHRPPITEIPLTTRPQPSPINTPLVHIPHPETVEHYVNYKTPTARDLPSRRLSTGTSTLNLSALSSNSALRLVRQHAQPLSSETHSSELIPSPYFTSGFETASLLSSNAQTAFLSGDLFSQVVIPTPFPAHVRLPEYYTAEHSRPPTPNIADYPLRVDGITIYDPQNDPRFPSLPERFIPNNDLL